MFQQQDERKIQIEEGAKMAQREDSSIERKSKKETTKLTGHETFLKALETSRATIRAHLQGLHDGSFIEGVVKRSDKYTISLRVKNDPNNIVIFKSAIAYFYAVTSSPRTIKETAEEGHY